MQDLLQDLQRFITKAWSSFLVDHPLDGGFALVGVWVDGVDHDGLHVGGQRDTLQLHYWKKGSTESL